MARPLTFLREHQSEVRLILIISSLRVLIHLVMNAGGGYGFFRDEFYYLACARHPDIGYVDHPPVSVWLLGAITWIGGESLFVVRLIPALCAGITTALVGLIALRLGGGRMAAAVACLFSFTPISTGMFSFYSMNATDFVVWATVAFVVTLLVEQQRTSYWVVLGVVLGIGLMNKISVLFLGTGLFAGLLFTPNRRWLMTPGPYIAGAIALMLFIPYVVWNARHDWAHLEFIRNASEGKYASLSSLRFLTEQLLINNPVSTLVWVTGLGALLFAKDLRRFRILAFLYAVPLVILVLNRTSKAEYLAPAYVVLWAAGGIFWEGLVLRSLAARIGGYLAGGLWALSTAALLPLVLPVLPVGTFVEYSSVLGVKPKSSENKELGELPQFYADMFGWKEKAEAVATIYHALPETDRERCAIFASNYGRCGAIDYYGKSFGLPPSIGNHNNYWIWGPRDYAGEVMIILGGTRDEHEADFEEVSVAAVVGCSYCMPYEDNLPVFVCRKIRRPLAEIWPGEKKYD